MSCWRALTLTAGWQHWLCADPAADFAVPAGELATAKQKRYYLQQTPGATFNLSALGGSFAFLLAGSGSAGPLATAGNFVPDSGNLASGVLDENVNGTPAPNLVFQPSGANVGTYTLASNGRGTLTFATTGRTYKLVFYLGQVGTHTTAVLQETDSGIAGDGNFTLQQSAAFALSSIQSNYAMQTSGTSGGLSQVMTGQVGADGAGAIKSGSLADVNTGTLNRGSRGRALTPLPR